MKTTIMDEFKFPQLREIKEKYEKIILEFILNNSGKILDELDNDEDYQANKKDSPVISIFDNYLNNLEKEIRESINDLGYFNGTATRLIQQYKDIFYYSSLPNLSENR